jgi:hypothetical protein
VRAQTIDMSSRQETDERISIKNEMARIKNEGERKRNEGRVGNSLFVLRAISPREIRVALYVLKCLCCWLLLLLACWLQAAALTDHSICADVQQTLQSTYSMFGESLGPYRCSSASEDHIRASVRMPTGILVIRASARTPK